jgi:hypothetical protein
MFEAEDKQQRTLPSSQLDLLANSGAVEHQDPAGRELDWELDSELYAIKSLLERLARDSPPDPQNFVGSNIQPLMPPGVAAEKAEEDAKRWTSIARHNALEEACAQRENGKREGNLPTISVTLQSFEIHGADQTMEQIHAGAKILLTESIDDTNFTHLRGYSGHLLEDADHLGNLYIAVAKEKRRTDLKWADLKVEEPLEVLYEGTWYQASVSKSSSSFPGSDRVEVRFDGHPHDQAYEAKAGGKGDKKRVGRRAERRAKKNEGSCTGAKRTMASRLEIAAPSVAGRKGGKKVSQILSEIEKGENGAWKKRLRPPLPALHLYGPRIEVKDHQQGIRKEHNRRFKSYGSVRDKLMVLQSLCEVKDMPPDIVKSIAQVRMRQALDFEQMQQHGDLSTAASCAGSTNASQLDAISSIRFDVEGVQGPPGTGKSTMICTILENILEKNLPGKRTLVSCVQNKAVFAVADKICAQSSLFFVIAGARNLEQYRAKGEDDWPPLAKRCTAWGRALRGCGGRRGRNSPLRLGDPDRLGPSLAYKMAKTCSRLARFWCQDAAKRAQQLYERWILQASDGAKRWAFLRDMGIVQDYVLYSWTSSDEEDNAMHWRCMIVLGRWVRLCSKMRYGRKQKARQASWIALTDAVLQHNVVETLVPFVEAQADVWLATVDSAFKVRQQKARQALDPPPPLFNADVVILDEAGSMPEWKMPLLTRFQPRLLLLVGDHKQLPPFTSCQGGFRPVSVLERMVDALSSTATPVKILTTQFRMHPDICQFVSAHFYNERLETDELCALAARERTEPPIVWRTHGGDESRAEHSKSTENREEARIICGEILPALFADPHYAGKKIVIITMYKAQLRLLEQMFTEHQHTGKTVVMTVDSAQGSEADIVILSLVRSNAEGDIGHARDRQRINVALSRAKDRLLIVGNDECFRSDRVWRDLLRAASVVSRYVHHRS